MDLIIGMWVRTGVYVVMVDMGRTVTSFLIGMCGEGQTGKLEKAGRAQARLARGTCGEPVVVDARGTAAVPGPGQSYDRLVCGTCSWDVERPGRQHHERLADLEENPDCLETEGVCQDLSP